MNQISLENEISVKYVFNGYAQMISWNDPDSNTTYFLAYSDVNKEIYDIFNTNITELEPFIAVEELIKIILSTKVVS